MIEENEIGYESFEDLTEMNYILRVDKSLDEEIIEWEENEERMSLKRMKIADETDKPSKRNIHKTTTQQKKVVSKEIKDTKDAKEMKGINDKFKQLQEIEKEMKQNKETKETHQKEMKEMKVTQHKDMKDLKERIERMDQNNEIKERENREESQKTQQSLRLTIPNSQNTAAIEAKNQNDLRKCRQILKSMQHKQESFAFNEPVDPIALGVPTYFTIIKHPMDFGTINKIINGKHTRKYTTKEDFHKDMMLVFDNAMLFNDQSSDVYKWAVKLKGQYEAHWETHFGDKNNQIKQVSQTPHTDSIKTERVTRLGTPIKQEVIIEEKPKRRPGRPPGALNKNPRKTVPPNKKEYTKDDIRKLRELVMNAVKSREKRDEILKIVEVDGTGKTEVSINLNNCTNEQLRQIERVIKGKRGRKPGSKNERESDEELRNQLVKLQSQQNEVNEKMHQIQKKGESEEESDEESSLFDSEEENLMRMSNRN